MPLDISSQKGTTLLELILAIAMAIIAVVIVSMTFPQMSATLTSNRRHWLANNFATARIQELKEQPYALVPITSKQNTGGYFASVVNPGGCNCESGLNWSTLVDLNGIAQPDATYSEDGINYTRQVCIHLVDNTGLSYCQDSPITSATDHGLKHIHIRVSWTAGINKYFTDAESMVTR